MKIQKKLLGTLLAATMTMSLAVPAMAADPTEAEKKANADTIISIFNTTVDPTNVSFEVPLYVTMAAVTNKADVVVPDNYGIKNTSTEEVPNGIAVTAMSFSKLEGSTFETVATNSVNANNQIYLTIGNVVMPAMDAPGTKAVDLKTGADMGESAFYNTGTSKFTKIDSGETLALPLKGVVQSAERTDGDTVAQFKVTYVVSALDAAGDPIGAPYIGNDSEAAGLGKWNDGAGTWQ